MQLVLGPNSLSTSFEFSIPIHINKIVVFLSGGLDSAALLCLILTELKNTNRLETTSIKCFTVTKNDGSMNYSAGVVDLVSSKFDKKIYHFNNFTNDHESINNGRVGLPAIKNIWSLQGPNTKIYMAMNKMAPDSIRPFSQTLKIQYQVSSYYESPFLNLHKPQILDIFYKLGCEQVILATHTCTVDVLGKCGNCYSCAERHWGFTSLGKVDPI